MVVAMLEVREVSHSFGQRRVLDEVLFAVPPGIVTGLLGPNGAGKTTLMLLMLGVIDPDGGDTRRQGQPVTPTDRRRWGTRPRSAACIRRCPPATSWSTWPACTEPGTVPPNRRADCSRARPGRALGRSGPTGSPWCRRAPAVAAALVHQPEVIVLDEPFAGLDPVAVDELSRP